MCGITAYLGTDGSARAADVGRAAARLRHRGPDGEGLHVANGSALAHRRLSIIDVAGGRQPLLNEEGQVALACNGEIYNFARLRSQLEARHRFRTLTDSEVIVHLYEELGPALVHLLEGMFAFVVSDGERLFAARDPLGIKPLYIGKDRSGGLWVASELKALADLCPELMELPPGCTYTRDGGVARWFEPRWSASGPAAPEPFEPARLVEKLEAAVLKRLMSDVPLGVFLSGGLDSSLIAALMRPHVAQLHSFAVGLEGASDLEAARAVARHLGTCHHEYVYTPAEASAALETVIEHLESYDAPLVRSAVPCYFVSKLAAQHVKVVLSGEGADEAFAGYLYFRQSADAAALQRESVRLLDGLHNMNLQRVDRMTMAHSLEGRVPFLDIDFLETAMALDPAGKLHGPGRPEKWLLRRAFAGRLPDAVLWRQKQEFAQGAGAEDVLAEHCASSVSDADLARADQQFPADTPASKEELHYRRLFEEIYPGEAVRRTVGRWRGALAPVSGEEAHA